MTFGREGDEQAVEPAADYDRFVDWDKRLSREAPFFRRVFDEHRVKRVVDVGAGSGKHTIMWAGWGLDVTGVDPDASMLAQAARNALDAAADVQSAGGAVRFVPGGFGDLGRLSLSGVDVVTCTGNALPHVAGLSGLNAAVADFAAVLRTGGIVVLHLLNHDRLLSKRIRAIPPVVRDGDDGRWVFIRLIDYVADGISFDFITLHHDVEEADWSLASRRSIHTALPSATLVSALEEAGFGDIRQWGNHEGKRFDPAEDESVILVAVKR